MESMVFLGGNLGGALYMALVAPVLVLFVALHLFQGLALSMVRYMLLVFSIWMMDHYHF